MFYIIHNSGLYFHNKGRIILFETQEEASSFMNMFLQYATEKLMQDGRIGEIMRAQMVLANECKITQASPNIQDVECGVVFMKELFENTR